MASQESKSQNSAAAQQQYWADVQQQQQQMMQAQQMYGQAYAQQQYQQPAYAMTPQQMYAMQQQQQMYAMQQAQAQAQAAYYGMAPTQPQVDPQQMALMQQLQQQQMYAQAQAQAQAHSGGQPGVGGEVSSTAVVDPNSAAYMQQLQAMQQLETTAAYNPDTSPPLLYHRSEPGQLRHRLRVNIMPWLTYRTLWLLLVVAIAVACVAAPLLRLSFLEDPEKEPQGLRALLAVIITYGLSRVVILMWGRAHKYSGVSPTTVGLLADASPIVVVITAGLSAWFQPHEVSHLTAPDVTSTSYKIATVFDLVIKYAYLFVLIPLKFHPWGGMKPPQVARWACSYCGTVNVAPPTSGVSRCVACGAFNRAEGAAEDAGIATLALDAAAAGVGLELVPTGDDDTGAGAGAGAGVGAGTGTGTGTPVVVSSDSAAAVDDAAQQVDGDAPAQEGSKQDAAVETNNEAAAADADDATKAVATEAEAAGATDVAAVATDVAATDSNQVALQLGADGEQKTGVDATAVDVAPLAATPTSPANAVAAHKVRKSRNSRPQPVSNAVCALIPLIGLVSEILRIWDLWPASLSVIMVAPWLFLIWYDHGRRQWSNPAYLNLCLFTMYYLPSFGGLALIQGMVENHDDTAAECIVLAVWVGTLMVVQWLWNVSAARAMTPIDAWPLTFHLDLFVEMLHRMILVQLTPFGGVFFAFILLHGAVNVIRHSDLGTVIAHAVFGIKRDLSQEWALTADKLEERYLRAQAAYAAAVLATTVSFIAVGGDLVLDFGTHGVTEGLTTDEREEHLGGLIIMLVVSSLGFAIAHTILKRRIRDAVQRQLAAHGDSMEESARRTVGDIATSKILSWAWDNYVWVFCSGVVFCLIQPLAVAALAGHGATS